MKSFVVSLVVFVAVSAAFAACPDFTVAPTFPVGSGGTFAPLAVAVADFNGDGKADVATANQFNNRLSVLLGNGTGGLGAPTVYSSEASAYDVAVGDFNADGKMDVAAADYNENKVAIYINSGNGTFANAVNYAVETNGNPDGIAVADINGDSKLDLVTANYGTGTVSVLLGVGNGTFGTATNFAANGQASAVAVADFNGDGKKDLVVPNYQFQFVSILLGDGAGAFAAPTTLGTTDYPTAVAVDDFNGDTKMDIAVADRGADRISIFLGIGNATFATVVYYPTSASPSGIAVGDFNADGKKDLAVANLGSNDVSIFKGVGNGTFAAATFYAAGEGSRSVAVGDFNNDGKADLVTANSGVNSVGILIGKGNLTFTARENFYTNGTSAGQWPVVDDFNGDGKADVVVSDQAQVRIRLGTGTGRLGAGTNVNVGGLGAGFVAVGDFNADGKKDLAVGANSQNLEVLIGNGNGTFATHVPYTLTDANHSVASIAVSDFNADGKSDLAAVLYGLGANAVAILLGNGTGIFGAPVNYAVDSAAQSVAVADFNADGKKDLAVLSYGTSGITPHVGILIGNGNGTFAPVANTDPITDFGTTILAADFNGDGKQDLVANSATDVQIFIGNGNGTFAAPVQYAGYQQSLYLRNMSIGDVNGDGKVDVIEGGYVLLGNGDGTLAAPIKTFGGGLGPFAFSAFGDFNGDGRADLALCGGTQDVSIMLNNSACATITNISPNAGPAAGSQTVTITGTSLANATSVTFGGSPAGILANTGTTIQVHTPAHAAAPVNVVAKTGGGTATSVGGYTYLDPPTITSVAPNGGPTTGGQSVTITGTNLLFTNAVTFGGTLATKTGNTSTTVTVTTPAHAAGLVDVILTTEGGTVTSTGSYTYIVPGPPGAPTGVAAMGVSSSQINVTWTAVPGALSYQVDRKAFGGSFIQVGTATVTTFPDTGRPANTAFLYRVRAVNDSGPSTDSASDVGVSLGYTNNPLSAGTIVQAVHLSQLRTALTAVCALAGAPVPTFTDSATAGTRIRAIHITELRTQLDVARQQLGLSTGGYTNPSLAGVAVKAVHVQELRNRM